MIGPSLRRVIGQASLVLCAMALLPSPGQAQTPPPATDVILFTVVPHGDHLHARSLVLVTERDGYDNQPSFLDEDHLIFTSAGADGVTNILRYSVWDDAVGALTQTPESEYSPRRMPSGDAISVVRVALDGISQELVRYPLDGGPAEVLLPGLVDIGYYAWIDEHRVALFRLGDPPTLHIADLLTGEVREVASGIGPVVQPVPGRAAASFVQRAEVAPDHEAGEGQGGAQEARWLIRLWDGETGEITTVAETLGSQPDHVWLSSSSLLSIHAGRVFRYLPAGDGGWHMVLDDLCPVFGTLARLSISPSGQRWALVIPAGHLALPRECV
jgi:hypothetical protein